VRTSFNLSILARALFYINQFLKYIFITINTRPPLGVLRPLILCSGTHYIQHDKFISLYSGISNISSSGEALECLTFSAAFNYFFKNLLTSIFLREHRNFLKQEREHMSDVWGNHSFLSSLSSSLAKVWSTYSVQFWLKNEWCKTEAWFSFSWIFPLPFLPQQGMAPQVCYCDAGSHVCVWGGSQLV
jgi:hypothetical protein